METQEPITNQPDIVNNADGSASSVETKMDGRLTVTTEVPATPSVDPDPVATGEEPAKSQPENAKQVIKPASKTDQQNQRNDLPNKAQKAIARAVYEKHEALRKFNELQTQIEELKKERSSKDKPVEKLDKKNFLSEEDYIARLVEDKLKAARETWQAEQMKELETKSQSSQVQSAWDNNVVDAFGDGDGLVEFQSRLMEFGDPSERLPEDTVGYIAKSKAGPLILDYFASHGDFAEHYSSMHPVDQQAALLKIRDYVTHSNANKAHSTQHTQAQQQAQPEVKPMGRLGGGATNKSFDDMSQQERIEYHRKNRR